MIEKYISLIEKEITKQKFGKEPESLYEPIRYIMALGGKRMRPLLTALSYSLYKNDVEQIIPYAVAVEAFHNFTLLHDDIMDKAPLRRGKPTVHEKWNVNTAILSGDVMLVKVYDMFLSLEERKLKKILSLFNICAAQVCEGQQWDMEFETRGTVTEKQYLEMIKLKTAVLLGFSLELGAVLANAPVEDQKALRDFGVNIGIGFQLKDDWLDVYGVKAKFGKQVGGDILANKKTFLLIKALERSKGSQRKDLQAWLSLKKFKKAEKINAVTAIYNNLDLSSTTESKMNYYFQKGFQSLNRVSKKEKIKSIIDFTKNIIRRES
ncbi:MAG TPA: isoprenyl synthetase [Cytophagales bacterium]|jgi:geranylgeranyl diphosphate synthase, type II|nr:isoprenyl synthetase [Cytophagales bacterium]